MTTTGWVVGDIETDGLLPEMSKFHCLVLYDWDEDRFLRYNDQQGIKQHPNYAGTFAEGVERLNAAPKLFFHNGHGFDYLALKWFHPLFRVNPDCLMDTRTMAESVFRNIKAMDFAAMAKGKRPENFAKLQLVGKHSLKAWGYRLGVLKGDIADEEGNKDFSKWTPELEDYCEQDVRVTVALLRTLLKEQHLARHPLHCHELDNRFQHIMARQEAQGFLFNEPAALELFNELQSTKLMLERELRSHFPSYYKSKGLFTPTRADKKMGYTPGVQLTKVELVEFNPGSRDQIGVMLQRLYGWEPTEFGADGKPTVDEDTLAGLTYPLCPLIMDYLKVDKVLGQLAAGNKAWLKFLKDDGRIHGRINISGAHTWRCTHSHPNMAQVPSVKKAKDKSIQYGIKGGFGADCRDLFCVPAGRTLCGHDGSGLELRCLAHYMARYDDGVYADVVVNGDVHTLNQQAIGLYVRDNAKTWIYAFLYGAGDPTLGMTVLYDMPEEEKRKFYAEHGSSGESYIKGLAKLGKTSRARIAKGFPALGALIDAVKAKAKATGTLRALDGRLLTVNAQHAALNTLLQSTGALLMKRWLVILDQRLLAAGREPDQWRYKGFDRKPGGDYEFVANVHDEAQTEVNDEVVEQYHETAVSSFPLAGQFYNFRCAINGEGKRGRTWTQTH